MTSILIAKEDSFVFDFYESFVEIEKNGRSKEKLFHHEIQNCEFKKGKKRVLLTVVIAVVFLLFVIPGIPKKIFKVRDQLVIDVKNKPQLKVQIANDVCMHNVNEVVHLMKQQRKRM